MVKQSFSFFLLLIILSCKNDPTLTFTLESFSEKELKICDNEPCSVVLIDFPKAMGDMVISEKINGEIEQWIATVLFLGEDDVPSAKTIESAAEDFILAYRDHQADLPTILDTGGYEAEINISVGYQSPSIISFSMSHFTYTGGAHGYGGTFYLNLDGNSGNELTLEDLFTNLEAVTDEAEKEFRKMHDIAKDENINTPGFWFENDTFHLSTSMGFSEDHLLITYNPYEIAPYSEGVIELKVPLSNIDSYLNFEL